MPARTQDRVKDAAASSVAEAGIRAVPDVREIFAPITKVYDGPDGFFVEGILVAEEPDRMREIWDYETSKPQVLAWASDFASKTGGASVGNLRAMHGNVAAGRFLSIIPDDEHKRFNARAEVVDEQEKEKVRKRVYTGFSIKAPYARKWMDKDPRYTRWTQGPMIEGSLVDLPCIYSATFSNHPMKYAMATATGDGGDVVEIEVIPDALISAAVLSVAKKGMYEVAEFASLCSELQTLRSAIEAEREMEGDVSPVTDRICQNVDSLLDMLVVYTQEQVSEMQHGHEVAFHSEGGVAARAAGAGDTDTGAYYEEFGEQGVATKASQGEKPVGKTKYLVHDDKGNGHLPYTDASGNISHGRMGAAWAALHGGYRGREYEGPSKSEAIAKLERLYKQEGMTVPDAKKSAEVEEAHKALAAAKVALEAAEKALGSHQFSDDGQGHGKAPGAAGSPSPSGDQGQGTTGKAAGVGATDSTAPAGFVSVGKTSDGVEIFKRDPNATKRADVEAIIDERLKPLTDAMETFVKVAAKMSGMPVPSGVARNGATTTDKAKDGAADNRRAADQNGSGGGGTAEKSASELAKEGKVSDAIKSVHANGPAMVMTNRGIERPTAA